MAPSRAPLRPSPHPDRGFSAVELLVVIALIGFLVAVSTPAMLTFFQSMKVRTAANRMMTHVRLCRQVSVSRRVPVTLKITGKAVDPEYVAFEDKNLTGPNQVHDPDGDDSTAGTVDDEAFVVQRQTQMAIDKVVLVDCYNDTTPADPLDDPGSSIMVGNDLLLRLLPNGQLVRLDAGGIPILTDTLIRVRLEKVIGGRAGNEVVDRWEVTLNRAGKVGSDFHRFER